MFREKSSNGLYGGKDNEKSRGLQSRGIKNTKNQEEARKKQPGAVCGRRAAERGISFPRRRGRRRVPGERPGRRFGNWCHWGLFLAKQPRRRRALPPVVPGRGCRPGIGGSAPFAAPWRSQFLFHIIKRNYESHGKALKPFPASLSFAASPRLGRGGLFAAGLGLGDVAPPGLVRLFERGFTQHTSNTNRNRPMKRLAGCARFSPRHSESGVSQILNKVTKNNRHKQICLQIVLRICFALISFWLNLLKEIRLKGYGLGDSLVEGMRGRTRT